MPRCKGHGDAETDTAGSVDIDDSDSDYVEEDGEIDKIEHISLVEKPVFVGVAGIPVNLDAKLDRIIALLEQLVIK